MITLYSPDKKRGETERKRKGEEELEEEEGRKEGRKEH
jgi:hypothetical protein